MTRTSHGWHIPGSIFDDEQTLRTPEACGGTRECLRCAKDARLVKVIEKGHILLDVADPKKALGHLYFLKSVMQHNYGALDGEVELHFLDGLIKQLEEVMK